MKVSEATFVERHAYWSRCHGRVFGIIVVSYFVFPRKGTVLNVVEAAEPGSIRWEDLNLKVTEKLKQTTVTTCITVVAIFVGGVAVTFAERASPGFGAAFTISGTTVLALAWSLQQSTV